MGTKQAQHMPGPYIVMETKSPELGHRYQINQESTGAYVGQVNILPTYEYSPQVQKANADLLAAAPDMLKAIRNDHSNAGCVSYGFNDKNPCWHLKIINRATGKS